MLYLSCVAWLWSVRGTPLQLISLWGLIGLNCKIEPRIGRHIMFELHVSLISLSLLKEKVKGHFELR